MFPAPSSLLSRRGSPLRLAPLALALLLGCGDDALPLDAGFDAGLDAALDGGFDGGVDSGVDASFDSGADAETDAGADASLDAGPVGEGFGSIVGTCGRVAAELGSTSPSYFVVHLDFASDGYDEGDRAQLTAGAQEILEEGTAGGSSEVSEAFAMEVLARCEGASLLFSETEIEYDPADSDKTDMIVSIDAMRVGVSVTRAFHYPLETDYELADAERVIGGKLTSIPESTANVVAAQAWGKQILAVLAFSDQAESIIDEFRASADAATLGDTILYVIVTEGDDAIIYD